VKSAREQAAEKRAEKLALIRDQIQGGSLVVRKMTAAERLLYPRRQGQRKSLDRP
jgi:hypothetical protein